MPPATLTQWIAARAQKPIAVVHIAGREVRKVISVDVNMGTGSESPTATIRVAMDTYPTWDYTDPVRIALGYGGAGGGTFTCFVGEVEDIDASFAPYSVDVKASGYLKRAQRNAGNTDPISEAGDPIIEWSGATDSQIWSDIMKLAGIPRYFSGDGDSRTIAGPIQLMPGDNLRSKITELDAASESGQMTFEFAGTVWRQAAIRIPAGTPSWRYAEGNPTFPVLQLYSVSRQKSDRDVKNQAIIEGTPAVGDESSDVVGAVVQTPSTYWGTDGFGNVIYVPYKMTSEFLETRDQCTAVANRYMYENNKITDVLSMRTPLNPYAMPARTVGLTSLKLGLPTETNYWVRQVHHHWGPDGASTDWSLEGGAGQDGYLVGLPPIAMFEMRVTKETTLVDGDPVTLYTVVADGSGSYDPDGTALSYAWSNNKNGDTGTGVIYTTSFSTEQWDDAEEFPEITLVVTDSDSPEPHTGELTLPAGDTSEEGGSFEVIAMYVAALAVAEATPDGWETVNTWTPPANCLCCCRIAAGGTNYFGLANGTVWRTTDYLETEPELVWTSVGGAGITALWMSELDTDVVAVGTQVGQFYITKDGFLTAPVIKYNFGNTVQWINGSIENVQQWRVAAGQDVWYTDHDFTGGDVRALVTFELQTVVQSELTPFANYASASGSAGQPMLKREGDGFPIPFPSLSPNPTEVHMTAFIDTDTLLVGDDQGRSFLGEPASSAGTLVQKTNVGYGKVNDLMRDWTNMAAAYAACDTAVAKTFDRAETWVPVRSYNGTTQKAMQLGYDSDPIPIEPIELVIETDATDKAVSAIVPGGWGTLAFDDSSYPNAVEQSSGQGWARYDYGGVPPQVAAPAAHANGVRKVFEIPDGTITAANIVVTAYNQVNTIWINGNSISPPSPTPPTDALNSTVGREYSYPIPTGWLTPGGDNVVAVAFQNGTAVYLEGSEPAGYPPGNDKKMGVHYVLTIT